MLTDFIEFDTTTSVGYVNIRKTGLGTKSLVLDVRV